MSTVRIIGVGVLVCLLGAAGAGAQTPTPDPAPVPPPPTPTTTFVEPAPAPTVAEPTKTKPTRKHKARRLPPQFTLVHPTFAEKVPRVRSHAARTISTTHFSARFPPAPKQASSPLVLILVAILGSGSLLVVALKEVPEQTLRAIPGHLADHHGEVVYGSFGLLLGVGIGLLAAFALQ